MGLADAGPFRPSLLLARGGCGGGCGGCGGRGCGGGVAMPASRRARKVDSSGARERSECGSVAVPTCYSPFRKRPRGMHQRTYMHLRARDPLLPKPRSMRSTKDLPDSRTARRGSGAFTKRNSDSTTARRGWSFCQKRLKRFPVSWNRVTSGRGAAGADGIAGNISTGRRKGW